MSCIQRIASPLLVSFSLCVALTACDSERGSTPPQEEAPPVAQRSDAAPSPSEESSPDAVAADPVEARAALRSLYSARHTQDLPTRETVEAHPGGEDAVRWLAQNDDAVVVRVRALASLEMFPNDASEAVVREVLTASNISPTIKAAALRALKGWDLSQREDLRTLAITGLQSEKVPVAAAAAQVLANVPEANEALEKRLAESPPPAVERAIRSSL